MTTLSTMSEETLRTIIRDEMTKTLNAGMANGIGTQIREIAHDVVTDRLSSHETGCLNLRVEHLAAERWKLIAIVAVCGCGGGGIATGLLKFVGK